MIKSSKERYDYDEIYQQALSEMQQPDFFATWKLLTAWGTPSRYAFSSNSVLQER